MLTRVRVKSFILVFKARNQLFKQLDSSISFKFDTRCSSGLIRIKKTEGFCQVRYFSSNGQSEVPQSQQEQDITASKLTWVGLFCDLGLFGFKGIAGVMSGSAALIADALHSGSDLASGFVTLGALKLARKPPDKKHPYGYGHYETLGSLGVSTVLFAGSVSGMYYSVSHLYFAVVKDVENMLSLQHVPAALLCCALSVLVKEALFRATRGEGERQKSPVLLASAWHHRSDALSSFAAFLGITGFVIGLPILDPLLGFMVGGLVLKTSFDLGYSAVAGLTDRQRGADEYIIARVEEIVKTINEKTAGEVRDVHNIRARRIGNYLLLDISVVVNPKLSVTAGFHAASKVRQKILREFPEVKDVSTKIQGHSPAKPTIQREVSLFEEERNPISFEGRVSDLKTRGQGEIENDIKQAVEELKLSGLKGVIGVSHCSVHFKVSELDAETGKRALLQKVEVNLNMDNSLVLSEARSAAFAVKQKLLTISDIHAVDIHVELLEF